MKKLLMAAVAVSAIAATPAIAADFAVSGTVGASCSTVIGETLAFNTIGTNASGNVTAGQSKSSGAQDVVCNGANATITVASTQVLTNASAPTDSATFQRTIGFTAEVTIGGTPYSVSASPQTIGATAGSMVVSAKNLSAALRPYAGSYSGLITVTLAPGA